MKKTTLTAFALMLLYAPAARADCCCDGCVVNAVNKVNQSVLKVDQSVKTADQNNKLVTTAVKDAILGTQATMANFEQWLIQSLMNQQYNLAKAEAQAELAARRTTTPAGKTILCNTVTMGQGEITARAFADSMYKTVKLKPYSFDGSGVTPKCIGPNAGHDPNVSCAAGQRQKEFVTNQCALRTGDPNDFPNGSKCVATNPEMIRADRDVDTLFGPLKYVAPDNKKAASSLSLLEQKYLAAVNFCYTLKGAPANKPSGDNLNTLQGVDNAILFDRKEAISNALYGKCLKVVTEHARGGCDKAGSGMASYCTLSTQICGIAKNRGMDVSKFGNCTDAMSYEEVREIVNTICLTNSNTTDFATSPTAGQADVIEQAQLCNARVEAYRANVRREYDDFVRMVTEAGKGG